MNILGHKYIFLGFSTMLVIASLAVILVWGLKLGIDFTGGSLLELSFSGVRPSVQQVRERLKGLNLGALTVQESGERGMLLRFKEIDEPTHQQLLARLREASGAGSASLVRAAAAVTEERFDTIGPTIGRELRTRAVSAIIVASIAIVAYIAFAFRRVSRPVASWKYGVAAVVALLHDVLIPTGVFAVLGKFQGLEIDALFITAMLTVMGFSVHDTIVVFDRTRENLGKLKSPESFAHTVNRSVNQTIVRSLNTSLTVLLVLLAVFLFGGATVRNFALALIVGVAFGTYSSIFVASPLLVMWEGKQRERTKRRS